MGDNGGGGGAHLSRQNSDPFAHRAAALPLPLSFSSSYGARTPRLAKRGEFLAAQLVILANNEEASSGRCRCTQLAQRVFELECELAASLEVFTSPYRG